MQFESLQVFCDVVRYRSFSQAAAANNLTQSAVSQIVLQLEKRMQVQLIDRSTRPLQLTPLGQTYYDGCKALLENYLELEASIRTTRARLATTVQVAAIYSVGLGNMGQYVEEFVAQHPQVTIQIDYLHPDRVCDRVLAGTADFGLLSFPRKTRELTALSWRDEEMVLVCAPSHPLAKHKAIKPAMLEGEKYIGFDKDLVIRREVDRFLRDQAVGVQIAMEFDNIENIKQAIEIGAGVALLPEPTLRREVQAGTLVARPLADCRLVRPLAIIHRKNHPPSATASGFMNLLRQSSENGSSGHSGNGLHAGGAEPQAQAKPLTRGRNGAARAARKDRMP
jgi:DNA-binding transcriptional LysR family regulator